MNMSIISTEQNPALVYLAGFKASSRRAYLNSLAGIATMLTGREARGKQEQLELVASVDWSQLRFQHTNLIRSKLAEAVDAGQVKPNTANHRRVALRGVLKVCWKLKLIDIDDYQTAIDIDTFSGSNDIPGRFITGEELSAMLESCGNSPLDIRDIAIISILYSCGLRRAEIVNVDMSDLDINSGRMKVTDVKENKELLIYIINGARAALEDWLMIRGNEPGPIFCPVLKGGRIQPNRLTTQAVYHLVKKRAREAEIKEPVSPHDFRRTFISNLLESGVDIVTIQKMVGHSNIDSTAKYDRRGEEAKRKAASLLKIPYSKRKDKSVQNRIPGF